MLMMKELLLGEKMADKRRQNWNVIPINSKLRPIPLKTKSFILDIAIPEVRKVNLSMSSKPEERNVLG